MVVSAKALAFAGSIAASSFAFGKLTYNFSLDAFIGPMLNPVWWSNFLGF